MNFYSVLPLVLLSYLTSIVLGGDNRQNGSSNHEITKKLRRYKICNGTRCKSIRSFNPPSVLFDMDSFLYSRWTRWAPCSRHCTTKRYRACKFPLVCGNTILHEEAFCYHRGTHCEHIFENNQRDFLASSGADLVNDDGSNNNDEAEDIEYFEDYVDKINKGHALQQTYNQQDNNPTPVVPDSFFPSTLQISNNEITNNNINKPVIDSDTAKPQQISVGSNGRGHHHHRPIRHPHRHGRNQGGFSSGNGNNKPDHDKTIFSSSGTVGPIPTDPEHLNYIEEAEEEHPTCGIARITDGSRDSGMALRILGGRETKKGKWPWQVALMNRMQEVFCGGTLIGPRWVLTAAYCIRRNLRVIVGEHHLHRHDGTEKNYKVQAAFIHPNFDRETVDNDVALLLLPEPVPTAAGLACLPRESQPLPQPETLCTILGWGKRNHTHVFGTTTLHEGKVPIVSNLECRFRYGAREITNNMFCAGYRRGTVDSCAGDSGGPILCTEDNRWTVFGVTSFGDGSGRKNKFGIYAKVPNYVGWIRKVMKANEYYYG